LAIFVADCSGGGGTDGDGSQTQGSGDTPTAGDGSNSGRDIPGRFRRIDGSNSLYPTDPVSGTFTGTGQLRFEGTLNNQTTVSLEAAVTQISYLDSDQFDTAEEITTLQNEGPEFSIPSGESNTIEGTMPAPNPSSEVQAFFAGWESTK
jgi:hypothetical protein